MSDGKAQGKRLLGGVVALAATAMLAGCASGGGVDREPNPADPWEGFNRKVFAFNDVLDRYALKPVARGYRFITPDPVETGVGNFFSNLGEPRTVLNSLLQGKVRNASIATSRFLINTTVGVGGLWDVASRMEITGQEEDFGQTLGAWGWEESRYLVLPLLGPSTLRDTGGLPADMYAYPTTYIDDDETRLGLTALRVIDTRAGPGSSITPISCLGRSMVRPQSAKASSKSASSKSNSSLAKGSSPSSPSLTSKRRCCSQASRMKL